MSSTQRDVGYHRRLRLHTGPRVNDSTPPLHAAPITRSPAARVFGVLAACFAWLMCTLAAGALSALAALWLGVRPCWPMLVFSPPLVWVLGMCGGLPRRGAAWSAAVAVLLAGAYAACLAALARVASAIGYTFGDALHTGGLALVVQVAKLGLDAVSILVFAAAAVLAAILAERSIRRTRKS